MGDSAAMEKHFVFDKNLTEADTLLLQNLLGDFKDHRAWQDGNLLPASDVDARAEERRAAAIKAIGSKNDPKSAQFEPTVTNNWDLKELRQWGAFYSLVLKPYIRVARSIVRVETDVVMLTHLLLYFTTSVPSAIFLFYRFSWLHGVLHMVMQFSYVGTYTLMMHQHIHGRGVLNKSFALFDTLFPYLLDPLMGHTWNSYYYHHVKHHHVEGNGPDDLSSTIRYQRDNIWHFAHYVGRFYFLIWFDLPYYFVRKGRYVIGFKAISWELASYAMIYTLYRINSRAAFFVVIAEFLLMRLGLMSGNWGQHAFVSEEDPTSDYRSSITLIDTQSNRQCYNDGYHTSHHLNPLRHWRDHPVAFAEGQHLYAEHSALVFHNIDFMFVTIRLIMQDYETLAKCMVPISKEQISMSMEERMAFLKRSTRKFTEEEIRKKYKME